MIKRLVSIELILLSLILCLTITPGFAQNQNADTITNKLNRIQRDLQVLSRQVFKNPSSENLAVDNVIPNNSSPPSAYITRIEERLSQLDGETRQNTGSIENISHILNQISARLDSLGNDINFRLTSIEKNLNFLTGNPQASLQSSNSKTGQVRLPQMPVVPKSKNVRQIGPSTGGSILGGQSRTLGTITQRELNNVTGSNSAGTQDPLSKHNKGLVVGNKVVASKSNLPSGTPMEQYKFAFSLVRKQEFIEAIEALKEFIQIHPKEPLTVNARNWLGRTFYVRKDYGNAARVFLVAYQDQPKGKKAADNLFRLGLSLAGLKKSKEACAAFDKLEQDFPKRNSITKKQLKQQREKIKCG